MDTKQVWVPETFSAVCLYLCFPGILSFQIGIGNFQSNVQCFFSVVFSVSLDSNCYMYSAVTLEEVPETHAFSHNAPHYPLLCMLNIPAHHPPHYIHFLKETAHF